MVALLLVLREVPCTIGDEDWNVPEVPESVQQLLSSKNWTMENPSPACLCSCEGNKKMLPDCPAGAGGLPPPEVRTLAGPGRAGLGRARPDRTEPGQSSSTAPQLGWICQTHSHGCCCSDEAERHRHAAEPDGKKRLRLPGQNLR